MKIPEDVRDILVQLNEKCYDAFLVGGCVRDFCLGVEPNDYDITTNAKPDDIMRIFKKTIPTGIQHGTVTVVINSNHYEVTTYRVDGEYSNNRSPDCVQFTDSLKDDLSRRDFTINAMAMNADGKIYDYFGGQEDLSSGLIRCVGVAKDRLSEDRLRALRAIRFASRFDFEIDDAIIECIRSLDLSPISIERIRSEFDKILLSNKPSTWIRLMVELDLLTQFIPELIPMVGFEQNNPHHDKDVFNHTLCVLDNVEQKLELRLSALFHDIGKPYTYSEVDGVGHFYEHHQESSRITRNVMHRRMKYSNVTVEYVSELVYWHMIRHNKMKRKTIKKMISKIGIEKIDDLVKLQVADILGSKPIFDFEDVYRFKFDVEQILNNEEPFNLKDLDINGYDLMELGYKGKEIGSVLNHLLESVIDNPELNGKNKLIEMAKDIK